MALRLPSVQVYAIEADPKSQNAVRLNAEINDVKERVQVKFPLGPSKLNALLGSGTVLIMDCEGCEAELVDLKKCQTSRAL